LGPSICKPHHAIGDETPGFVPNHGAVYASLTTALGSGVTKEHNGPDEFVGILEGINKLHPNLVEIFRRRHRKAPFEAVKGANRYL
jgi:hypothetical protein